MLKKTKSYKIIGFILIIVERLKKILFIPNKMYVIPFDLTQVNIEF